VELEIVKQCNLGWNNISGYGASRCTDRNQRSGSQLVHSPARHGVVGKHSLSFFNSDVFFLFCVVFAKNTNFKIRRLFYCIVLYIIVIKALSWQKGVAEFQVDFIDLRGENQNLWGLIGCRTQVFRRSIFKQQLRALGLLQAFEAVFSSFADRNVSEMTEKIKSFRSECLKM